MAIPLWNWARTLGGQLFESSTPGAGLVAWAPPDDAPRGGRWYAIVRDASRAVPWSYSTRCIEDGRWVEFGKTEQAELVQFLKLVASELPDSLWTDERSRRPGRDMEVGCFDLRLLDFSLARFDRPDVVEAITRSALEARARYLERSEAAGEGSSGPTQPPAFAFYTVGKIRFGACWYGHAGMLRWSGYDILRSVPDAEELKELIDSFRDSARLLIPPVPLLEEAAFPKPPPGVRRRPAFERDVDRAGLEPMLGALDKVIAPPHDLALAAFQTFLDQLAGHACPSEEDNKWLASQVMLRADEYGFHLFAEKKGDLVPVRLDVKPARNSLRSNPSGPAAQSGVFSARYYDPVRRGSSNIGDAATFPPLIAARNLEQARRIWEERKPHGT